MDKARAGDCNFYIDCVESVVQCRDDGYALGYGFKYCTRFAELYNDFNDEVCTGELILFTRF